MTATNAIALLVFLAAAATSAWFVICALRGLWRIYRSGPPSRMATSTRPAPDSRNWSKQYMDSIKSDRR